MDIIEIIQKKRLLGLSVLLMSGSQIYDDFMLFWGA